jgi:transcriptional regulator with XRE-family HTH domain
VVNTTTDKTTKEFGLRIKNRRREMALSQEELGEVAGLHRTYIGHLERGEVNPSLINILRVAKALKIDPSDLVSGLKIPKR